MGNNYGHSPVLLLVIILNINGLKPFEFSTACVYTVTGILTPKLATAAIDLVFGLAGVSLYAGYL